MKRTVLAVCLFAAAATVLLPTRSNAERDNDSKEVRIGFAIAPVPLNLKGLDRQMVGLGSYIVNAVGGCNDCHTNPSYAPDGDPYLGMPKKVNAAGYLAGGTAFGPFISRNITPYEDGLPAGLTFAQFNRTMRTGYDIDQKHPQISPLLQVMPWPVYQSMTPEHMRAVYEYLRAIPPIDNSND